MNQSSVPMSTQLTVEELKNQNDSLSRDLDQAISERNQSATYGLALVKENTELRASLGKFEHLYEVTKNELRNVELALTKCQQNQKDTTRNGIEYEERLLSETAALELSLNSQILELENDLQKTRQDLVANRNENERLIKQLDAKQTSFEYLETEVIRLKKEVRELKLHETKLCDDYTELEEENVSLEKLIAALKQKQTKFDSFQHDIYKMKDEIKLLKDANDEMANLKSLADIELQNTVELLTAERKKSQALQKKFDSLTINREPPNIHSLASRLQDELDKDDSPYSFEVDSENPQRQYSDLYSELQGLEMKKLENKLEICEKEKETLNGQLTESNAKLTALEKINLSIIAYCKKMESHTEVLDKCRCCSLLSQPIDHEQFVKQSKPEIEQLVKLVREWSWTEIDARLMNQETEKLKCDLENYRTLYTNIISDWNSVNNLIAAITSGIETSQTDVLVTNDELNQFYQVHNLNAEELLAGTGTTSIGESKEESVVQTLTTDIISLKTLENLQNLVGELCRGIRSVCEKSKLLHSSFENFKCSSISSTSSATTTVTGSFENPETSEVATTSAMPTETPLSAFESEAIVELQAQVLKLKYLLVAKREQIVTLRTVLKSNKNTADEALNYLKNKYGEERNLVSATMSNLRNELKDLKQQSITFTRTREMYASRCQEYANRIEKLSTDLEEANEEKKTLNNLLKMVIIQKIDLTQRLEDCENREIENRNSRKKRM